jgi:hypothetical protein
MPAPKLTDAQDYLLAATTYSRYASTRNRSVQLDTISWIMRETALLHIAYDAFISVGCYDSGSDRSGVQLG